MKMRNIINKMILTGMFALTAQICLAGAIKDLEKLGVEGRKITLRGVPRMEVVVVSDLYSENNASNPNITYKDVDLKNNKRTVYVQETDGSKGMRLVFDTPD